MTHAVIRALPIALLAALVLMGPRSEAGAPVDINTATAAELTTVKGIGPAKAQAIIEHRDKHGAFKSVDDLKLVRGIGEKTLEQLRPQLSADAKGAGDAPPGSANSQP